MQGTVFLLTWGRLCACVCVCVCVFVCLCVCVCVCVYTRSVQESARASTLSTKLVSFCRRAIWLSANDDSLACAAIYNAMACLFLFPCKAVDKSSYSSRCLISYVMVMHLKLCFSSFDFSPRHH